uniref:VHS domain-containing protein n=1 Tax=Oryza rufipogon TaxID=4529 RepID=A0A0E0R5B9_ORYRU
MATAVACAERATSDMLIGPDWAVNIELCDIINMDPGYNLMEATDFGDELVSFVVEVQFRQAKDTLKLLKKRLGNKNSKVQILTLYVLETLSKNCGDVVYQQIIERDILSEMNAGVDFPPREENTVPLFTPPQTQPLRQPHLYPPPGQSYEDAAIQASLQSSAPSAPALRQQKAVSKLLLDDLCASKAPTLRTCRSAQLESTERSLSEIQSARGIVDVLDEMLNALDHRHPEGVREEVIVDLVGQCRSYQGRVMDLVSNTGSARDGTAAQGNLPSAPKSERPYPSPLLPPPPSSKRPVFTEASSVDYLSGDSYKTEKVSDDFINPTAPANIPAPSHSKTETNPPPSYDSRSESVSDDFINPTAAPSFSMPSRPMSESNRPAVNRQESLPDDDFINPTAIPGFSSSSNANKYGDSGEDLPKAPWEAQAPGSLPPPPARYGQRQQYFEQQHGLPSGNNGAGYNGLVSQTEGLSLNQRNTENERGSSVPTASRQTKPEDSLFKDLVDFAKNKPSSPSKPANSRRTR